MSDRVILPNGTVLYLVDGLIHREDGPSVERQNGNNEWYINGVNLTTKITQWIEYTKFNPNYTTWTDDEKFQFKLQWC